jgi:hypothetical protein
LVCVKIADRNVFFLLQESVDLSLPSSDKGSINVAVISGDEVFSQVMVMLCAFEHKPVECAILSDLDFSLV